MKYCINIKYTIKVQKICAKVFTGLGTICSLMLVFLSAVIFFSMEWMFDTWSNLTMDELLYHLNTPLDGTNMDFVFEYLDYCVTPAIIYFLTLVIVYLGLRGLKRYNILMVASVIVSVVVGGTSVQGAADKLDATSFVQSKGEDSTFVKDYYVSPAEVELQFPEKNRNLIYIFLESMETTYADMDNGGAFEYNVIPELTTLSLQNENFSGNTNELNGGHSLSGTTWTIGAMFAQTSGLPLNISIDGNDMDTQDTFFSGVITLGDILKQAGYSQTLMLGSDATFGGRRLYFTEHGNFDIVDYNYAIENKWIPEDYHVWWGYEDEKLFEFSKNKLLDLAAQEESFNFTMLTVDTHFEDGWVCDICPDAYGEDQYANVMACSSFQVAEFVKWVQEQDFYENTTIVICGDHPTMDKDFCGNISDYDRKVYTAIINSAIENKNNQYRIYSTFDLFPTTLAAIGVHIEGDRLGLGTNLFSGRPTISEEIGIEAQNNELGKKSSFMEELANLDENSDTLISRIETLSPATIIVDEYDPNTAALPVYVSDIQDMKYDIKSVMAAVWTNEDQSDTQWIELFADGDRTYHADVDVASYGYKLGKYSMCVYVIDSRGKKYFVGEAVGMVN